jgi:glutaminyl-tRNA synthetase
VGYFVVDAEDSRPGKLALNRIVGLRDSWTDKADAPPVEEARTTTAAKASTRPPKRSRAEYRAEARVRDPELADRFAAWPARFGITEADADLLTADRPTGDLFLAAAGSGAPAPGVARLILNELPPLLGDRSPADTPLTGAGVGALVAELEAGSITGAVAKEVLAEMVEGGGDPRRIIADRGLAQVSDEDALAAIVDEVVAANAGKAEAYRAGKTALFGFFVGQVMRASQGRANPQVVQKLLTDRLAAA